MCKLDIDHQYVIYVDGTQTTTALDYDDALAVYLAHKRRHHNVLMLKVR